MGGRQAGRPSRNELPGHLPCCVSEIDISQEQLVWEHPLVVTEVRRRQGDLRQLAGTPDWPNGSGRCQHNLADRRQRVACGPAQNDHSRGWRRGCRNSNPRSLATLRFYERRLRPLGHLSAAEDSSGSGTVLKRRKDVLEGRRVAAAAARGRTLPLDQECLVAGPWHDHSVVLKSREARTTCWPDEPMRELQWDAVTRAACRCRRA